jgi:hypothetical protein
MPAPIQPNPTRPLRYPQPFSNQFPAVAAAFEAMVSGTAPVRDDPKAVEAIREELKGHPTDDATTGLIFEAIWADLGGSTALFLERTGKGFAFFGVNDEARALVGGIWAAALRRWTPPLHTEFLHRFLTLESVDRELALEFLPTAFHEAAVTPDFLHGWIDAIRQARGQGYYPHHIQRCLETYGRIKPLEALELVQRWISGATDEPADTMVAMVLHWTRESPKANDPKVRSALDQIEASLTLDSRARRHAVLLESWAFSAASATLDEKKAIQLQKDLVGGSAEELRAWCFLLAQVVVSAPVKWQWSLRELQILAQPSLIPTAKLWVGDAAMKGWAKATAATAISRTDWESLFFALAPMSEADDQLWQQWEYFIVDAYKIDPGAAANLIVRVAETSGTAWSKLLETNRDSFAWLCQSMRAYDPIGNAVTALCLSPKRSARRIGVRLFERCGLQALEPGATARADTTQIERILLESILKIGEYDHLALLHISVAGRVDQIGGELAETFYGEVKTEALNTNQYRQSILTRAAGHAKLCACVTEAEQEINKSNEAAASPALQMHIPGYHRAQVLARRRFDREVSKSVEKHSIFAQICTTVQLLYGRTWRIQDASGSLTAASALQRTEVSTELPRLEFMTPEAMRQRRLIAAHRLAELDQTEGEE